MLPLNTQYRELLEPLACNAAPGVLMQENDRTGDIMYRHSGPQTLSVDLTWGVPVPRWRRLAPHIPFADTIWQMMGTTDLTWLNKYAAFIWGPYAEDGILPKAYGRRWGWQLGQVVEHLINDPTSRQVYMATWDAEEDLADGPRSPMPPCLLGVQFRRIADTLESTVFMRSCDIMVGLPHDMMNMGILTHLVAHELDIAATTVHFAFSDLHLYAGHRAAAQIMLSWNWPVPMLLPIPREWTRMTVRDEMLRDDLVVQMRETFDPVITEVPWLSLSIAR